MASETLEDELDRIALQIQADRTRLPAKIRAILDRPDKAPSRLKRAWWLVSAVWRHPAV